MELDLCSGTKASRGMRASQKTIGVQYALMQVAMTRWPVGQFMRDAAKLKMSVRRNLPRYKTGSEPVLEYIPRFPGPGPGVQVSSRSPVAGPGRWCSHSV